GEGNGAAGARGKRSAQGAPGRARGQAEIGRGCGTTAVNRAPLAGPAFLPSPAALSISPACAARLTPLEVGCARPVRRPFYINKQTQGLKRMATVKELKATARAKAGKGAARAVRREGRVPGVIYGDKKAPVSITLDTAELTQRIYAGHFLTTLYDLEVDGTKHRVIPRDFQLDPIRDTSVHVDFMRLGENA